MIRCISSELKHVKHRCGTMVIGSPYLRSEFTAVCGVHLVSCCLHSSLLMATSSTASLVIPVNRFVPHWRGLPILRCVCCGSHCMSCLDVVHAFHMPRPSRVVFFEVYLPVFAGCLFVDHFVLFTVSQ